MEVKPMNSKNKTILHRFAVKKSHISLNVEKVDMPSPEAKFCG